MKCVYCHTEIDNDATFCTNCGKKVPAGVRCSHCGAVLEEGSEFCPYCGTSQEIHHEQQKRKPIGAKKKEEKKNRQISLKPLIYILFFTILGLLAYYLFITFNKEKANKDDSDLRVEVATKMTNSADSDSVYQAAIIEQHKNDSLLEITKLMSDSLASLKDSLNKMPISQGAAARHPKPSQKRPSTQEQSNIVQYGTKDFGYASYRGNLQNGKPHGVNGKMIFKRSNIIDSRDSQARVAEPGDYVIGEWVDGKLVQGIWFDADGQRKGSILIGK